MFLRIINRLVDFSGKKSNTTGQAEGVVMPFGRLLSFVGLVFWGSPQECSKSTG
jgi:hypothetical protein